MRLETSGPPRRLGRLLICLRRGARRGARARVSGGVDWRRQSHATPARAGRSTRRTHRALRERRARGREARVRRTGRFAATAVDRRDLSSITRRHSGGPTGCRAAPRAFDVVLWNREGETPADARQPRRQARRALPPPLGCSARGRSRRAAGVGAGAPARRSAGRAVARERLWFVNALRVGADPPRDCGADTPTSPLPGRRPSPSPAASTAARIVRSISAPRQERVQASALHRGSSPDGVRSFFLASSTIAAGRRLFLRPLRSHQATVETPLSRRSCSRVAATVAAHDLGARERAGECRIVKTPALEPRDRQSHGPCPRPSARGRPSSRDEGPGREHVQRDHSCESGALRAIASSGRQPSVRRRRPSRSIASSDRTAIPGHYETANRPGGRTAGTIGDHRHGSLLL